MQRLCVEITVYRQVLDLW